jgi:F0F1-type ATP synthase assembly protein I
LIDCTPPVILCLSMGKKNRSVNKQNPPHDDIHDFTEELNAKSMFIEASMSMGWRLGVMVVIPIVAGVKIDDYFNSAPSMTLTGIIVAAMGGTMVVYSAVRDANKQQEQSSGGAKEPGKKI